MSTAEWILFGLGAAAFLGGLARILRDLGRNKTGPSRDGDERGNLPQLPRETALE